MTHATQVHEQVVLVLYISRVSIPRVGIGSQCIGFRNAFLSEIKTRNLRGRRWSKSMERDADARDPDFALTSGSEEWGAEKLRPSTP